MVGYRKTLKCHGQHKLWRIGGALLGRATDVRYMV